MRPRQVKSLPVRRYGAVLFILILSGCAGTSVQRVGSPEALPQLNEASSSKIQHIVFIVQENRSFDNLFNCFPGTECVKTAPGPAPQPEPTTAANPCPVVPSPSPGPTAPIQIQFGQRLTARDIDHTYCAAFVQDYDGGKMDGFYWNIGGPSGIAHLAAYETVGSHYIQPYWDLAQQYVLADRTFPTQASGSFTAHQDLIRGDTVIEKGESVIDYPWNSKRVPNWGCDDVPGSVTSLITSKKKYLYNQGPFPCFGYSTLRDTLDAKGITWKYYVPIWPANEGQYWNAFDAIDAVRHDPDEWPAKLKPFNCTQSCVSWPETNVFCDISGSTQSPCPNPSPSGTVQLPAVSWVIPDGPQSDHGLAPTQKDKGPDWVASIVNKIGKSRYWNSTVIFIVWDDWGGYYDHVPPPQVDYQGLGFRVPMIIVSPYAMHGYVSHTQYEFGSLVKFVEQTFGLPSLGTTDVRANSVKDAFDFNRKPRKFVPIAPLNAQDNAIYFMRLPPSGQPVDTE